MKAIARYFGLAAFAGAAYFLAVSYDNPKPEPKTMRVCGKEVPQTCVTFSTAEERAQK